MSSSLNCYVLIVANFKSEASFHATMRAIFVGIARVRRHDNTCHPPTWFWWNTCSHARALNPWWKSGVRWAASEKRPRVFFRFFFFSNQSQRWKRADVVLMSRQHQVLDVEIEGGISVIIFSLSFFFSSECALAKACHWKWRRRETETPRQGESWDTWNVIRRLLEKKKLWPRVSSIWHVP